MVGRSVGGPDQDAVAARDDRISTFLLEASAELTSRATGGVEEEAAIALAAALEQSTPTTFEPAWLPVLDTIDEVDVGTDDGTGGEEIGSLARHFVEAAPLLPWVPTRRATDGGTDFGLAPLDTTRDLGELTVGIMYVRARARYPLHRHQPQELYLLIAGQGRWRHGGASGYRPYGPGSLIYNHPNDLHSAVAGPDPLVALYVLWPDRSG